MHGLTMVCSKWVFLTYIHPCKHIHLSVLAITSIFGSISALILIFDHWKDSLDALDVQRSAMKCELHVSATGHSTCILCRYRYS
jgi:hypothetical protein